MCKSHRFRLVAVSARAVPTWTATARDGGSESGKDDGGGSGSSSGY
ncbi:hypothetical protein [Streptomyces sp. 8N706]